jgi:type IV pilus assembly protein PilM
MFRLMRSQLLPIGVDIGFDSVKMLQLEVVQDGLSVLCAAKREMPEDARAHPDLRDGVAIDLIRQMLRQESFRGNSIVTTLPRQMVHVKNLRMPSIPHGELGAAVQFEARNIFPFDADQAHVRHLVAGEVRQGHDTRQEVIVLAATHDDVNFFLEQLNRSGCVVESLDFEPAAIYRSVERFIRRRQDESEVHVLVDVGWRGAQVVIGRGRDMSFVKPIEIGGRHFHEAVSRKLEIKPDEARELRRRIINETSPRSAAPGDVEPDPVRQAVRDATRSIMEELAREVSLCLRYHSVTFRGQRPAKLRLTGGEAADPQLQSILASALPIPVEAARPLLSVNTAAMQESDRRERMCEWTVAFGLALKLTSHYFGARDGRARSENSPGAFMGAEVIDLSRAVQPDRADARAGEHPPVGPIREEEPVRA